MQLSFVATSYRDSETVSKSRDTVCTLRLSVEECLFRAFHPPRAGHVAHHKVVVSWELPKQRVVWSYPFPWLAFHAVARALRNDVASPLLFVPKNPGYFVSSSLLVLFVHNFFLFYFTPKWHQTDENGSCFWGGKMDGPSLFEWSRSINPTVDNVG